MRIDKEARAKLSGAIRGEEMNKVGIRHQAGTREAGRGRGASVET